MKVNDDDSIADDDHDESLGDLHKKSDLFDPSKDKEGGEAKKRTALDDDDDDDFEDDFDLDLDDPLSKAKKKKDAFDSEEKSKAQSEAKKSVENAARSAALSEDDEDELMSSE